MKTNPFLESVKKMRAKRKKKFRDSLKEAHQDIGFGKSYLVMGRCRPRTRESIKKCIGKKEV